MNEIKIKTPRIDFHLHTNWTDGTASVKEMYDRSCEMQLDFILFSEHARSTSSEWFGTFAEEVKALPSVPCKAYVGVEARVVDWNGNINLGSDILSLCDMVVCSVHRFPGESGEVLSFDAFDKESALLKEFELLLAILDNPLVDILGHPFGVSMSRFGISPTDEMLGTIVQKAQKKGIAVEINTKYWTDPSKILAICDKYNAPISFGSDAHSCNEVGEAMKIIERFIRYDET
ncbi:MAG TPA: PHP domain-containing protein [Desulfuromonadaceae bacterium]|jgi:histidinol phosphatase-like PHP family hydrolase